MPDFPQSVAKAHKLISEPENYPGLKKRTKIDRKLLVWRYPSFSASCSWSLFMKEKICVVRRIVWDRTRHSLYSKTDPYTLGSEAFIDYPKAEDLLAGLSKIRLQGFQPSDVTGIDGTTYGIEVKTNWLNYRLSWWETPSEDWQPLLLWFYNTIDFFNAILPKKN